jgi:hypothetical protein
MPDARNTAPQHDDSLRLMRWMAQYPKGEGGDPLPSELAYAGRLEEE